MSKLFAVAKIIWRAFCVVDTLCKEMQNNFQVIATAVWPLDHFCLGLCPQRIQFQSFKRQRKAIGTSRTFELLYNWIAVHGIFNIFASSGWAFKAHSHYCIFCMGLEQMVVFLQGDRKFSIFALMHLTAKSADHCIWCDSAFSYHIGLNNLQYLMYYIIVNVFFIKTSTYLFKK